MNILSTYQDKDKIVYAKHFQDYWQEAKLQINVSSFILKLDFRGAWVAQSVKQLTSAQVMISQSVSSSPTLGSVLAAWSLEPTWGSVSPCLSAFPLLMLCLSVSQK